MNYIDFSPSLILCVDSWHKNSFKSISVPSFNTTECWKVQRGCTLYTTISALVFLACLEKQEKIDIKEKWTAVDKTERLIEEQWGEEYIQYLIIGRQKFPSMIIKM